MATVHLTRRRIVIYGIAAVVVVTGMLSGLVVSGVNGEILAMLFVGLGLVGIVSVLFLEVGLSEDRDRTRRTDAQASPPRATADPTPDAAPQQPDATQRSAHQAAGSRLGSGRAPLRRPARLRGERRRLR